LKFDFLLNQIEEGNLGKSKVKSLKCISLKSVEKELEGAKVKKEKILRGVEIGTKGAEFKRFDKMSKTFR